MKNWVDFLTRMSKDRLLSFSKYGDWCPPRQIKSMTTPGEIVSTLCYYESVMIFSKIAAMLGRRDEAASYAKLAEEIREAYNRKYLGEDSYTAVEGVYSQTANCIPLFLDIVPHGKVERVVRKLLEDLATTHDYHVNTGIVGTRYLLEALTRHGRAEVAYRLVTQTTYPSWGYMVREGATTLWERWEYLTGPGMNSHNHIMLGSIDAWFYKALAGINADPDQPGFEKILIKPHVLEGLDYAEASLKTIRGTIVSRWEKKDGSLTLEAAIPVNSWGEIYVPTLGLERVVVEEGGRVVWRDGRFIEGTPGVESGRLEGNYVVFKVGSGSYRFLVKEEAP